MISPLRGPKEAGTRNADTVTNTLTIATKLGRISKGWKGGMRSSQLSRRSVRRRLCTSVRPTDNYLSLAINCRRSDNADELPGDGPGWRRASAESAALDARVCALGGNAKAKRTGAAR